MNENSDKNAVYPRPFRTRTAATWFGISERQLLQFARAGALGKKVGNLRLFSQRELADFAGVSTNDEPNR